MTKGTSISSPRRTQPKIIRALSIQQPYVEEILRGLKTIEYRTRVTHNINQPFYLYASRTPGPAERFNALNLNPGDLPTGLLLGSATISHCHKVAHRNYHWHLTDIIRFDIPLTPHPKKRPQPMWWFAF